MEVICAILTALFGIGFGIFMALQPTEKYIKQTRLEGIVVSLLCAVLLVVLLFAPQ